MNIKAKLHKMENVPIPDGHARRNKGITTYFFSPDREEELENLLQRCGLENKGQMEMYDDGVFSWRNNDNSKMVVLAKAENSKDCIGVSIIRWQE